MNRRASSIFCLVLAALQSACSSTPHGKGGMAEHYLDTYISVEADHHLQPEHGLRFDFDLLRRQLEVLVLEGAEYCFPASVVKGREQEQRIARQLYGEMYFDATNDILIQRANLARLERQMDAVKDICRPPVNNFGTSIANQTSEQDRSKLIAILYDLLNSDNQFALDSFQLNPKYVIRLAEAAAILREHIDFDLRVIGHADVLGEDKYNADLSLQRAQQVSRYLSVMGVSPSRLTSEASGEKQPLFPGDEPHIRLVNRRVSVEIIDTYTQNVSVNSKDGS